MTLAEKLRYLEERYEHVFEVLKEVVPNLIDDPEHPTNEDLDSYNFWIDCLNEDEAQAFYHFKD